MSARQTIHMKYQILFSLKKKPTAVVISTLCIVLWKKLCTFFYTFYHFFSLKTRWIIFSVSAKILAYMPYLMIKVLMIHQLTTSLVSNNWAQVTNINGGWIQVQTIWSSLHRAFFTVYDPQSFWNSIDRYLDWLQSPVTEYFFLYMYSCFILH